MSQGSVGQIIEIAERAGDQMSSQPSNDTEPTRKVNHVAVGALIAGAVILAAGWYFFGSSKQMFGSSTQIDGMPVIEAGRSVIARQPVQRSPEPAAVFDNSQAAPESVELEGVSEELAEEELAQINASGFAADTQDEIQVQDATASVDELRSTEPAPSQAAIAVVLPSIQSPPGRLLQDLQTSLEWIISRDNRVGTLQIMLLRQNRFDDRVYYEYLDRLSEQGVDISQVRIFATYTGDHKVFSVVYGEYQNRRAANAAMTDLPPILQDAAPIGRSVGGLMEEIQRLEGKN
jgi:hypothetical protein